jgi:hypothetical protein
MIDVAERLKSDARAYADNIAKEYAQQVSKWQAYLTVVADQQTAAATHFENTLRDIKNREVASGQFALIALSVVGLVATSWIGAMIELKAYPSLLGRKVLRDGFEDGKYWVKSEFEFDEVAAKVWGDTINNSAGHVLDKIFETVMPREKPREGNEGFWHSIVGSDLASFRSNLNNELSAESGVVMGQLATLSSNINGKQDFGDLVVKEVEKRFPRPKGMKDDAYNSQLETKGNALLIEYFDKLRQSYAKEWFYYGKNPISSRLRLLAFHLEIEIWALWILDQDWRFDHYMDSGDEFGGIYYGARYWTNGDYHLEDIMEALDDLVGQQVVKAFWSQTLKDEIKTTSALYNAVEGGRNEPGTDADGGNASKDLARMMDWAQSVPGKIEHPNLDYRDRRIGTIADYSTVTAD